MHQLTAKELEYIVDSMSNEELLCKQIVALASQTQNGQLQGICRQLLSHSQQHYQHLLQTLQQHASMAPSQPTQ